MNSVAERRHPRWAGSTFGMGKAAMARRTGRTTTTIGVSGGGRGRDEASPPAQTLAVAPVPFNLRNDVNPPTNYMVNTEDTATAAERQQSEKVRHIGLTHRSPVQAVHAAAEILAGELSTREIARDALLVIERNLANAMTGLDPQGRASIQNFADHTAAALAKFVKNAGTAGEERTEALVQLQRLVRHVVERPTAALAEVEQFGLGYSRLVALMAPRGSDLEARAVADWQLILGRLETQNRKWAQNQAEEAIWKIEGAANQMYKGHIPGVQRDSLLEKVARAEFDRLRADVVEAIRNPKNVVRFPVAAI